MADELDELLGILDETEAKDKGIFHTLYNMLFKPNIKIRIERNIWNWILY